MSAIPVPYVGTGVNSQIVLGHYAVAQQSGAIAATPSALDVHARIRWAPTLASYLCVLMRLKLGWAIISAVTTTVRMVYQASIARGFTVDFTTACTQINMSTVTGTNMMRPGMSNSLMGAAGPGIATTAPCTGMTYALDNAPFAICVWPGLLSVTATGTAVAQQAGMAGQMLPIYEWTGLGQHPVILGNNMGVAVQLTNAGWASGTVSLNDQWEWGEVLLF